MNTVLLIFFFILVYILIAIRNVRVGMRRTSKWVDHYNNSYARQAPSYDYHEVMRGAGIFVIEEKGGFTPRVPGPDARDAADAINWAARYVRGL